MAVIPVEVIERRILLIRGQKVMLDADLAEVYGVATKRLNEQVKRNISRFPDDFAFKLTSEEKAEVVANCDHLAKLKFSNVLPYAFTEHGALMVASVLNTAKAVETGLFVIRAFVRLREMISSNKGLAEKLNELEKRLEGHGASISEIVKLLQHLMKMGSSLEC
ncbi:MAG: ORF6N domain-containing protein [Mariprofundus sp.]